MITPRDPAADDDELMYMDGFADCIAGTVRRFGQAEIVCYHYEKVIAKLVGQGMTSDEAVEYHEFNQIGAWVGERTPCFLERIM
jgi:hypothetical protein